ncbi:MAG: Coenzyme F420:L-glutamate ligase [Methanobacterium sp. PtaU1.Bin242]|nr:MAG: Coenzyme F420:L-glutamate ligase [Methanobacterium sp. PtaU1.Bin242]
MDLKIQEGDVLVIAETAVAKAEGNIIKLEYMEPGATAMELASKTGKDPELVEAILQESEEVIKVGPDFIISETKHGFVCANAGIDESNVEEGLATPIPHNPDKIASEIRSKIQNITGAKIAVIISDTQGRAFREGAIGVAIGISGMDPLWDRSGEKDLYGRELKTTSIAVADELASAASVVMGQADEGIPIVLIRGVNYPEHLKNDSANIKPLIRPKKYDVFR